MLICHYCNVFIILASTQQGEVESGTRRKVKRLLSFQRYCHNSRLLRGLVPHTPGSLHLLDDDYLGQAAVRTHADMHMETKVEATDLHVQRESNLIND